MRWLRAIRSDPRIDSVAREHAVWRVFFVSQAAHRVAELARNQYASGLLDFQTVLDAERTFVSFGDQLAQSKGQVHFKFDQLLQSAGWWVEDYAGNAAVNRLVKTVSIRSHRG